MKKWYTHVLFKKLIDGAWSRIELFYSLMSTCIISKRTRFKEKLTWAQSRQSQKVQKPTSQNLWYISKVNMIIDMKVNLEMKFLLLQNTFTGKKTKSIYLCMVYHSDWKNSTQVKKIYPRVSKLILQKSTDFQTKISIKKQEQKSHSLPM